MKRAVRILLLCVLVLGPALLVGKLLRGQAREVQRSAEMTAPVVPHPLSEAVAPEAPRTAPPRVLSTQLASLLNAPNGTVEQDVETLAELTRLYARVVRNRRSPPIGGNEDLAEVLTGRNPAHAVFLPPGHPALSADGRLVDRWGTPYFVHPLGRGVFEIRSAGPDRVMRTPDDAVDGPTPKGQQTEIPEGFAAGAE